jgi:ligand-binding sensor domain-containing protein/signal transduction histidine kinase
VSARAVRRHCDSRRTTVAAVVVALLGLDRGDVAGQLATVRFHRYGVDEGLSHSFSHALLQTQEGFLWVGTPDGLNRFDGRSFLTFQHDPEDTTSLSDDDVATLFEGSDRDLWVGTFRGGVNRLDPNSRKATRYPMTDLGPWREASGEFRADPVGRTVWAITEAGETLLLGTDAGLVSLQDDNGAYHLVTTEGFDLLAPVTALHWMNPTSLWLGRGDGRVALFEPAGATLRLVASAELLFPISSFASSPAGTMWVGTSGGGAVELRPNDLTTIRRLQINETSFTLLGDHVQDLAFDSNGYLWISTDQGLTRIAPRTDSVTHLRHDETAPYSLPHSEVYALLEDRGGSLWVGTWDGLARASPYREAIRFFPRRGTSASGLSEGVVAIEPAGDSLIWIGTWGGGVDLLSLSRGVVNRLGADAENERMLSHGAVFGLDTDGNGGLWIATMGGGVNRLDSHDELVLRAGPGSAGGAGERIPSVFVDRLGAVWAGSQFDGLHRFDASSQRFVPYRGPSGNWSFGSDYVWPIIEDRFGNLWVGAFEGGLGRIDARRTELRLYTSENSALSDTRILTLYEDPSGLIWIGTQGGGLIRMQPETEDFTVFRTSDGLPHDHVQGVVADDQGYIWVSTNDGVARFDPGTQRFWTLSASTGLQEDRFYANSVAKAPSGELLFGGPGGLSVIDPALFAPRAELAPLVLTRFLIHNQERLLAPGFGERGVVLEPDENFFTFEFAALDYTDVQQIRYRYRLEGLDREPIDGGARGVANYTSVPPGDYVFRVSASSSEGVWNEEGIRVPVRVKPPLTATWWFRLLVVAAIAASTAGAYNYRTRQQLRVERMRLRIAGNLHDDVGATLSTIALRAQMAIKAVDSPSQATARLEEVHRLARRTTEALREMIWVVDKDYDTISHLTSHLEDSARTLLGDAVTFSFEQRGKPQDGPISMEVRDSLSQLFRGALKNVLDHSKASRVSIVVEHDQPAFRITVEDDGVGFDQASTPLGTGTRLAQERARRHNGELVIASQPGKGTKVRFSIRLT